MAVDRTFTVEEARALLPALLDRADMLIRQRADLADLSLALQRGDAPPGTLPEVKALQAHVDETLGWFRQEGLQVKGLAPLLLDFPSSRNGRDILLCWLEGERELSWYHPAETGYLGRRRLEEDA